MPIFSQSLCPHTILLPADDTGNQLPNPSPWCLALQVSLIAKGNRGGSCVDASIRSQPQAPTAEGLPQSVFMLCYTLRKLIGM